MHNIVPEGHNVGSRCRQRNNLVPAAQQPSATSATTLCFNPGNGAGQRSGSGDFTLTLHQRRIKNTSINNKIVSITSKLYQRRTKFRSMTNKIGSMKNKSEVIKNKVTVKSSKVTAKLPPITVIKNKFTVKSPPSDGDFTPK